MGGQWLTHCFSTVYNSVGGQMLSVACSTKFKSSATMARATMSAALLQGRHKHDLTFSTSNNQTWCPGMSTLIKKGASDGAINVAVTEGATQAPPCCVTHSSTGASTPTSLGRM